MTSVLFFWVKFRQCFYMKIMALKTMEGTPCYLGTWRLEAALFRPYFISTSRRSTFVHAFCVLSTLQNYKVLTHMKVATDYIRLSMGHFASSDPSPTLLCILQPCANKARLISSNVLSGVSRRFKKGSACPLLKMPMLLLLLWYLVGTHLVLIR